jgi:hypothetical protein
VPDHCNTGEIRYDFTNYQDPRRRGKITMGAFFTNFQVRSESPELVADTIKRLAKNRAYVSSSKNGWVTVYEESADAQDLDRIQGLASKLSTRLGVPVFAFLVHDSDILLYWLYQGGELSDHYNSRPDYFAEPGEKVDATVWKYLAGKPQLLKPFCVAGTTAAALKKLLHREPWTGADFTNETRLKKKHPYIFEEQRLRELACLLGMDENRVCLGFHDVAHGGAGNRKELRLVKKAAQARKKR